MSEYLGSNDIERMSEALKVYDVDQAGWEHEGLGFEFNATHVLKHLVRDLGRKDFFDGGVVRSDIVPDSMQYALRLARWQGVHLDTLGPNGPIVEKAGSYAEHARLHSVRLGAYGLATALLSDHLHALDHNKERDYARQHGFERIVEIGQLLILSAQNGAREFGFNLNQAFYARLANLRQRFDIPEPT